MELYECRYIIDTFEALEAVMHSCFGTVLEDRYYNDIMAFARSFFLLMKYVNELNSLKNPEKPICCNVTPKIHAVFVHIKQYLDRQKEKNELEFGLGFYSAQPSETIHYDFDKFWVGSSFKRDLIHDDYPKNAKNAVTVYSSKHVGFSN